MKGKSRHKHKGSSLRIFSVYYFLLRFYYPEPLLLQDVIHGIVYLMLLCWSRCQILHALQGRMGDCWFRLTRWQGNLRKPEAISRRENIWIC